MAQLVQAHPDLSCSWFVTCMLLQILSRNTWLFKKILWLLRMHKPACSRSTAIVCNLHARLQSRSLIESLVWRSHEIHVSSEIRSQMEILTDPWLAQVLFENSCFQITPGDGDASLIIFWSRSRCCPVCGSEQGYANTGSHPLQSPDLLCFVVNMTCEFHLSWTHDAGKIVTRSRSEELASILRWNLHIVSRRHVDHVFSANATREFSYVCHWCFLQALWLTLWTTSSQAVFGTVPVAALPLYDNVWKISAMNVGGKDIVSVSTCEPLDMIADTKEQTGWSIWTRLRPDNRSRWGSSSYAIRACV
jgi:hypothetical protein